MSYRSVVLIKQVPDTANISGDVMKEDGTVNRGKLPAIFNPEDKSALEMALQVKERFGGEVVVVTMGPPRASDILREALYMGADRAMLISDRKFAGADTLATSWVLSKAIAKEVPNFDFVFGGRQAIDGDTAQVGPQTAEKLHIPQVTYAEEVVDIKGKTATIKHKIDGGYQVVDIQMPTLVTVIKDAAEPRPYKAKRLMACKGAKSLFELNDLVQADPSLDINKLVEEYKAKNLYIETYSQAELEIEAERIGLVGSPTKVFKVESVILTGGQKEIVEPTKEGMLNLIDKLMQDHILG